MSWEQIKDFSFGHPWWLLLLPVLFWWFRRLGQTGPAAAIAHSSTSLLAKLGTPRKGGPGKILRGLRLAALVLLVLAMARPRVPTGEANDPNKGIDIMLACDVSGSMDTKDFTRGAEKITRREALLAAISEFVDGRKNDRIGMVGFAKYTYLLSPMTTDGNWIKNVFKLVELKEGTAIGEGLFTAIDKLGDDPKRSKVIILVTDGLNNEGRNPLDAGEYARKKGVRVYALEIKDLRSIRATGLEKSQLSQIATSTGGQYFQASDTGALVQIYRQIDRMEKHEYDARRFLLFNELYPWLAGAALALLLFEWVAAQTFWMRLP
jgi:Ca-activated chloride channel family protein